MDFEKKYYTDNYDFHKRCCFERNIDEDRKEDKNQRHNQEETCCIKKVETYYCYPSYYNEEKKDDCKEEKIEEKQIPYYEGTFKLYPSYCDYKKDCHKKVDCKEEKYEDIKNEHKNCDKQENNNRCCCRNKFCLCCNLFGNFRRW